MSELKATPGPWWVGEVDLHGQRIVRGEHIEICTCWHHCVGGIEKEMEANAHLIAAAPVMYEELESLRDWLDGMNVTGKYDGTVAGIDMVLNIARGETQ